MENRQQAILKDYLAKFRSGDLLSLNVYNIHYLHQDNAFASAFEDMPSIQARRKGSRVGHFQSEDPEH